MELTKAQQNKIDQIGSKYNLKLILLHGSYATGRERPGSDLDIAVLGMKSIDFKTELELFGKFERVFGNNQARELDVKTLHNKSVLFTYQAVKDAVLLYGEKIDFLKFKSYALRQYQESRDIFSLRDFLIKKRFNKLKSGDFYFTLSGHKFYA